MQIFKQFPILFLGLLMVGQAQANVDQICNAALNPVVDFYYPVITDITEEYAETLPSKPSSGMGGNIGGGPQKPNPSPTGPPPIVPTPAPSGAGQKPGAPSATPHPEPTPDPYPPTGGGDLPPTGNAKLDTILTIGNRIWNFVVTNKPTATYNILKASVLPEGLQSWSELAGWSRPQYKVYRVELKNLLGRVGGSFEYKINFIYGGNYRGKGKFIGEISFVPMNINLKTDRSLNIKAQLLDPLNFGTAEDPIAGVHLVVTWDSPTTPRYQMNSAEYFMYGTGEVQDMN